MRQICRILANRPHDVDMRFRLASGWGFLRMGHDMAADPLSRQWSSLSRLRGALTPDEWLRLGSMFAIIIALHVIGWGTLVLIVEPAHLSVGDKAFGIGIG